MVAQNMGRPPLPPTFTPQAGKGNRRDDSHPLKPGFLWRPHDKGSKQNSIFYDISAKKKPLWWRLHNWVSTTCLWCGPEGPKAMARWGWGVVPGARLIQASSSAREASIRRDPDVVCSLAWPLSCHLQWFPHFTALSLSSSGLEVSSAIFRSMFSGKTEPFWRLVSASVTGNNILRTSRWKHEKGSLKFNTKENQHTTAACVCEISLKAVCCCC